ncbi:MAG: hypothetical protein ACYS8W_20835 [Planctomycetota bacterium]|jgi:hypothetical protein
MGRKIHRHPGLIIVAILAIAWIGYSLAHVTALQAGEEAARPSPHEESGAVLSQEEYEYDFENDADFDGQPDEWVRITDKKRMPWVKGELEPRKPYGKAYAIVLNHAPAALETRLFLKIDFRATYVFTAEVSAKKMGESSAWMEVRLFNKMLEQIPESQVGSIATDPVTDTGNRFITLTKTFGPLPEEVHYAKIRLILDGREEDYGGKLTVDNVKLKPFPAISLVPEKRIFRRGETASLELRFAGLRPGRYTGEKAALDWQRKPLAKPQLLRPQNVTDENPLEPELVALPTDSVGFYYFRFILWRDSDVILDMLEPFLVVEDTAPVRFERYGAILPDDVPSTGTLLAALGNLGVGVAVTPFDIYNLDNAEARRDQLQALGKHGYERVGYFRLTANDRKHKKHRGCSGVIDCFFRHEDTAAHAEKNFRAFGDSIEDWLLAHPRDQSVLDRDGTLTARDEAALKPVIGRLKKASPWTSLILPFLPQLSARLGADISLSVEEFAMPSITLAHIRKEKDIELAGGLKKLRRWAVIEFPRQAQDISEDAMIDFARQLVLLHASGTDTILVNPLWGGGLYDDNWCMRPPLAVYRTIVRLLGNHEPSPLQDPITGKELHLGPEVTSVYFHTGDEYLLAVWTDKPGGTLIRGFWGNNIAWSDIWGETRGQWGLERIPGREGKFREDSQSRFVPGAKYLAEFRAVREPRFITGIDVPLIKTQLSLQFEPDSIMPRSQPQKVSLRLQNFFSHEIRGRLRIPRSGPTKEWEFSRREFDYSLAPGATWKESFEVTVPSATLSGKRPISITYSTAKPGELAEQEITVDRELEIVRLVDIKARRDYNTNVVHLTFTNITGRTLALYAYTGLIGHATQENSLNLGTEDETKEKKITYPLPEILRRRGQRIRVHLVEKRGDLFQNDELPLR